MKRLAEQWLRPPGTLLLGLFLLTLVSVSALVWFGWRFVEQERLVATQRAQQHLEEATERLTTLVRVALAETADKLTAGETPAHGFLLLLDSGGIRSVKPEGKLLYSPSEHTRFSADTDAAFAEAEMFEFVQNDRTEAIRRYQRLSASIDPAVRAGALLRLARALQASGRTFESRAVWRRLADAYSGVFAAGGVPVQIAALLELGDGDRLLDGLRSGKWQLNRSQFEFYWSAATDLKNSCEEPPAEAVAFSQAVSHIYDLLSAADTTARGQETIWAAGEPWLAVWRGTGERRSALLVKPEEWMEALAGIDVQYALIDAQGRTVAGKRMAPAQGRAAIRPAVETQLPWTIYAVSGAPLNLADGGFSNQRYLLASVVVMVFFLLAGTYLIARAIRREAEVSRMQSDFVSSVSHEFRSPLTTLRQLSEILALGRVPSEGRRQLYYDTLVRETTRLQRVIESLLKFGQMDSGTSKYRFAPINMSAVVQNAVTEYRQQLAGSERCIELRVPVAECIVHADQEAMGVALRNLLDNAVKYSPDVAPVTLECSRQNGHVSIAVRDEGAGVTPKEQRLIFQKFVRGEAATAGNIKGSGLGLAMVRHIVAAHQGEVTVTSTPGKGSTFTILLPAAEESK